MPAPRFVAKLRSTSGLTTTLLLAGGVGASVLLLDKTFWPKCPVFALTGVYCPGCGGLRATDALLHGDLAGALNQNALIFALPVLLAGGFLAQRVQRTWFTVLLVTVTAGVTITFTILRNLPGSWLAPN